MFHWGHVWACRPCLQRGLGSDVVMLINDTTWLLLEKRQDSRTQNVIDVTLNCQVSVRDDHWGLPLTDASPKPRHSLHQMARPPGRNKPPFVLLFQGKHAVFHQLGGSSTGSFISEDYPLRHVVVNVVQLGPISISDDDFALAVCPPCVGSVRTCSWPSSVD